MRPYLITILAIVGFLLPISVQSAGFSCDSGTLSDTCTVTSLKTIDANDIVTGSGSLVIGSGGELRVATSSFFGIEMNGNITIQSGGKITGNLYATSTNFTIDIGGQINVTGKGYAGGTTGPGVTCSGCGGGGGYDIVGNSYGGGGGYGGNGSRAMYVVTTLRANAGGSYGSITEPNLFGSGGGGGGSASYPGGSGGGLVKIVSSGILTLNGTIRADGWVGKGTSSTSLGGGGSGGSIWIQTGTLTGTGSTTSNGGVGYLYNLNGYGGGGGGGRIAIYFTTNNSTIVNSATGAGNPATAIASVGAAGTIYIKDNADSFGSLTVSNGGYKNASTTIESNITFASTTIANGAILHIPDSISVDNGAALNMYSGGVLFLAGINTVLTSDSLNVTSGTSSIDVPISIASLPDLGLVTIYSGGTLTHSTSTSNHTHSLLISANTLTINSGGYIDVSSKGYAGGTTTAGSTCSGCGGGGGYTLQSGDGYGGGGGYGGNGSWGIYNVTNFLSFPGMGYGSISEPSLLGSGGGGTGSATETGGNGGGFIKLVVSGVLTNNGSINSNGGSGRVNSSGYLGGGGSGGSIWIQTVTLSGSGSINSNGGAGYVYNSNSFGGGGGGGRIAVYYTTNDSTVAYNSRGGGTPATAQATVAGAGTIYTKQSPNTLGSLTVTNSGYNNASTTISSSMNFASTTVSNGAILHIPDSVSVDAGSALNMYSSGVLVLAGANTTFTVDALNITNGTSSIDVYKDILLNPSFGNVTIYSGGSLSHSTSTNEHVYSLKLNADSVNIQNGGYINVSEKGYPGVGTSIGITCSGCEGGGGYLADSTGGGGAYGGNGGSGLNASTAVVTGGTAYGSESLSTIYPGSAGGGGGSSSQPGGNGGGILDLIVTGTLTNSGSIISNGGNGRSTVSTKKPGGGSGGSIKITSANLVCTGSVIANGGSGYWYNLNGYGGGGSGGRILINYGSGSLCPVKTALAGTASAAYGLASVGTVSSSTVPTVTTGSASSIIATGSLLAGTISDTGGSSATNRGFAYGLTTAYGATSTETGTHSTGSFSTTTYDLLPNTTYHFRAYAINPAGTAYGTDQQFITSIDVPTVSTDTVSQITTTDATLNATVGYLGGDPIIDRGFAYGLTEDYTATSSETGTFSTGTFTYDLSSLTCATTYHVRAYVSNSSQTGYGTDQTFTTSACPVTVSNSANSPISGSTVQSRVNNLIKLGLVKSAQDLINKWPQLFPKTVDLNGSLSSDFIPKFTKELSFGNIHVEVRRLQAFLAQDKEVYSDGRVTGYFGSLTKEALINFQLKNKIIKSRYDVGAGRFGPKTKAFVNDLLNN